LRCSFCAPPTTVTYTLSLHDALPISVVLRRVLDLPAASTADYRDRDDTWPRSGAQPDRQCAAPVSTCEHGKFPAREHRAGAPAADRKSTRLNSSHVKISYAVFCLKKK